jgi:hypothetical protein
MWLVKIFRNCKRRALAAKGSCCGDVNVDGSRIAERGFTPPVKKKSAHLPSQQTPARADRLKNVTVNRKDCQLQSDKDLGLEGYIRQMILQRKTKTYAT